MTSKNFIILVIILVIAVGAGYFFGYKDSFKKNVDKSITSFEECASAGYPIMESYPEQCRTEDGKIFVRDIEIKNDDVRNVSVKNGEIITSPLVITGEARTWYFEASFPISLLDGNGKQISQGIAEAQSGWMTTGFVPFKGTLIFQKPVTPTGTLVLHNDNPSGLPEHDEEVRIPIRFYTGETMKINLYYYKNPTPGQNTDCNPSDVLPVVREITKTQTPLKDSITLLIKGALSLEERNEGFSTEFPNKEFEFKSVNVKEGTATLEFSEVSGFTIGGSCRVSLLRAQIEKTAKQFSGIKEVILKPESLFQP